MMPQQLPPNTQIAVRKTVEDWNMLNKKLSDSVTTKPGKRCSKTMAIQGFKKGIYVPLHLSKIKERLAAKGAP